MGALSYLKALSHTPAAGPHREGEGRAWPVAGLLGGPRDRLAVAWTTG